MAHAVDCQIITKCGHFVFVQMRRDSYLGHVPNAGTGDLAAGFSRLISENSDVSLVRFESSDDASQQRRLTTTTGSQESVSNKGQRSGVNQ